MSRRETACETWYSAGMDSFILPPPVPLPLRNHLAPLVTQDATLWGPRGVISSVTLTPEKRLVDSGGVGGGEGSEDLPRRSGAIRVFTVVIKIIRASHHKEVMYTMGTVVNSTVLHIRKLLRE